MAVEIGTATDHVDLYNKLYQFLTANTELVAAGEAWSEVWAGPGASYPFVAANSDLMLKGPGLAGGDSVYVSMRLHQNDTNDVHGIYLRGHDAPLASSVSYDDHVNTSGFVFTPLFSSPMPYWFVANGRRFVVVAKVTTVYEALYAGLFLPFSTPAGYPYPLCVGGSSADTVRYSRDDYRHTHFVDPGPRDANAESGISSSSNGQSLQVRSPSGQWLQFGNNGYSYSGGQGTTYPWAGSNYAGGNFLEKSRPLLGGGYLLSPVSLIVDIASTKGALGALDGVFHVPGFGNAAENILSEGGVDHLVVQNVFRTDYEGYWALALQ